MPKLIFTITLFAALSAASGLVPAVNTALAAERLEPVVTGLPWPSATRLIEYRGEVWFVNSVKGRNHNSADIYSVNLQTDKLRYRHHLFSQDAGHPVKYSGRLYWPMEDDRFSLGWGTVALTDGGSWEYRHIPGTLIFHTHALAAYDGRLVSANSGWDAILNMSEDGGRIWRQFYRHPTPEGQVSRITSLVHLGDKLFAKFRIRGRPELVYLDTDRLQPVSGWPRGRQLTTLAANQSSVFAGIRTSEGNWELWSTNGKSSTHIATPFEDESIADLHTQDGRLWVLTRSSSDSGRIWSMKPDRTFEPIGVVGEGFPRDLLVVGKCVLVGGDGSDGAGRVWGSQGCRSLSKIHEEVSIEQDVPARLPPSSWSKAAQEIQDVLSRPARYRSKDHNLRDVVFKYALQHPPQDFFKALISEPMPLDQISLIGGRVRIRSETYAKWVLLWGMGLAKEASVPTEILRQPWSAPPNGAEKYFDNLPAALWAIRNANQNDDVTLVALVERLSRPADPRWLRHQVSATLSALTMQPFSTDAALWRKRIRQD